MQRLQVPSAGQSTFHGSDNLPATIPARRARSGPKVARLRAARPLRTTLLIAGALIALLLLFGNRTAALYTDWLWAKSLGYGGLWQQLYGTRLLLFTLFGSASFLLTYLNVRLADYFSPPALVSVSPAATAQAERPRIVFGVAGSTDAPPLNRTLQWMASLRPLLDRLLLTGALLFAGAAGLSAQLQWNSYLRFKHPVPWEQSDPIFHHDISFYVFTLPWLRYVQGWLLTIFLLIGAGVTAVYLYQQGINWIGENHARNYARTQAEMQGGALPAHRMLQPIPPPVRAHLSGLLGCVLLAKAWGYYLDRYDLLYGSGWLPGAGYTDVHVRLPMLYGATAIVCVAAAVAFLNLWRRSTGLPTLSLALWLGYSGLGVIVPGLVQRAVVQPNEASLEAPYIANTISATRTGYDLTGMEVRPLAMMTPERATRASSSSLWQNVPLWDTQALVKQWQQEVPLSPFEQINTAYLDRYPVRLDGKAGTTARLTALGVHEIVRRDLEGSAQTWLNRHAFYTHGTGVTLSLMGQAPAILDDPAKAGTPRYLSARDVPALATPKRSEPAQIFFGAVPPDADYALLSDDSAEPFRAGTGIPLTQLSRAAFAARYATWSLLLSQAITPDTRLLLLRSVSEHVKRVAPFLLLDPAPHPVVAAGRVYWIVPAYTTTAAFPNALVTQLSDSLGPTLSANYLRPSVLAVVDATTGAVRLYAADAQVESDPLLRSYQACFPNAIQPAANFPAELRPHRRYPLGMMTVQRQILSVYHLTDTDAFYRRAEVWDAPHEQQPDRGALANFFLHESNTFVTSSLLDNNEAGQTDVSPRYRFARIDSAKPDEFIVQSPLLLKNTERLAGVLVGRSDGAHYGKLLLYQSPKRNGSGMELLAPDTVSRRFEEAASLGRLFDGNQSPLSSASAGRAIAFSSGTVRMVLLDGYVLYVQPLAATGASLTPSSAQQGQITLYEPLPRLWRVRVGTGAEFADGPTLQDALKALMRKRK